jgi:hypothetical protein
MVKRKISELNPDDILSNLETAFKKDRKMWIDFTHSDTGKKFDEREITSIQSFLVSRIHQVVDGSEKSELSVELPSLLDWSSRSDTSVKMPFYKAYELLDRQMLSKIKESPDFQTLKNVYPNFMWRLELIKSGFDFFFENELASTESGTCNTYFVNYKRTESNNSVAKVSYYKAKHHEIETLFQLFKEP